jgi:serine/threonine-protein kinase
LSGAAPARDEPDEFEMTTDAPVGVGIEADQVAKLKGRLLKELPQYEIEGELGRGGVGVVFKARHKPTKEVVALKILMMADLASSKQRARFEEEAEITRRLNHPGIVPIREVGATKDGLPYYTMKFVDGEDLGSFLKSPAFTRERGLTVLRDVANAIQAAHAQGVVHRDLKPENILIEKATGRPYVLDFGLAKSADAKEKKLTVTGALLGTPYYMSYEQALGRHRDVDARTDVYALGAILYVILTGKPPFDAGSAGELFAKIIKEEPTSPRQLRADVTSSLEAVTLKALRKNKEERQPNAGAFAAELDKAMKNKDVLPQDEESVFSDKAPSSGAGGYGAGSKSADGESMFADEVGGTAVPAKAAPPKPAAPAAPGPAPRPATTGTGRASDRVRPGEGTGTRPRASSSSPDLHLDPARARAMRSAGGSSAANLSALPAAGSDRLRKNKENKEEPAFPALAPGTTLGEITVKESLGEEDGIRIFEVEKNGRPYVLREHGMPPQAAADLAAFAERLGSVRHDDVEPLLASGRSARGAWYVVDDRRTLRAAVGEKGPFAEKEALQVIRAAARALGALAARNVHHGDPSPRNVLLDAAGMARLGSPVRVRNTPAVLGAGPIMGDARYAAPGVLDGQAPVAADDVFTLGLTFAYLLGGKDPIAVADTTAAMVARSQLPGTVPDLASLCPGASEGARAFYQRLTERDPARRPQPAEVVADIEALLGQGKAPALLPPRPAATLPTVLVPAPIALALALAALLLAVIAIGSALSSTFTDPVEGYQFSVPTDGR